MTLDEEQRLAFVARTNADVRKLLDERTALWAAREEACNIATRVIADSQVLPSTDSQRIDELRKVGCRACDLQREGKTIGCLRHG